jgi:hypothetical protein
VRDVVDYTVDASDRLQPLADLRGKFLSVFAGRTMTMYQVYFEYEHLASTPFIKANYKQVLYELYAEGRITASRKPQRAATFADDISVSFRPVTS